MHTEDSSDTRGTPTHLMGYEVLSALAAGGIADVYLARCSGRPSDGALAVIKRLRREIAQDERVTDAFAVACAARRLNHPNIVQTQAAVSEGASFYIAEEFLDGKSLRCLWRDDTASPIPRDLHVWILTQVLAGLHYAHQFTGRPGDSGALMGLVHQNVNPSNVFITYGGEVKLTDFGIPSSLAVRLAASNDALKHKLAYAAPEQCLGEAVDHRADVFAVGVMLWEAITGRKRWRGQSDAEMFLARIQGGEPAILPLAPATAPELVSICERALARDPAQRFSSALEFQEALLGYLQVGGWAGHEQSQLCLLLRGQLSNTPDPLEQNAHSTPDERLNRALSGEPRASIPTGLTQTLPSTAHRADVTMRRIAASIATVPSLVARGPRTLLLAITVAAAGLVAAPSLLLSSNESVRTAGDVLVASENLTAAPRNELENAKLPPTHSTAWLSLSIDVKPRQARLQLDGVTISNPYFELHELDHGVHHLSVSLAGYETLEREVPFDRNVDWTIGLSPGR